MTPQEELLLEIEKIEKNSGLDLNSLLMRLQDLAEKCNISLEDWANGLPPLLIPKETSCNNCKYYVEIPPLYGLSDIFEEKQPFRYCYKDGLGGPLSYNRYQHGCCFCTKNKSEGKE